VAYLSILPVYGTQSKIQANHCSFPRPCIATLLKLQLRFATHAGLLFGSCRPRYTFPRRALYSLVVFRPRQYVTPTGHLTLMVIFDLGNLPPLLPQSIIDRQNRGIFRGIAPIPKLHAGRQLLWNGTSVDMQEGKDTADFFVPFQILWLTIVYGA
jgi:hypothetical protein